MTLIPVTLPEGVYKNGTPYTRRGRWADGNLVRWHDGAVRPIGGWLRRTDADGDDIPSLVDDNTAEAIRDSFAWRDNAQAQNFVLGSNLALYHISPTGGVTDITYSGYAALNASKNASTVSGYGQNPYGNGAYGVANPLVASDNNPPDRWYFGNFGEILLAGSRNNGGVYELDLSTLTMSQVTNAPINVQDLCVTDQRQVFVIGGGGEPRRIQASEIEDRTDWSPANDNQSVDRTLAGTGNLLRCLTVLRQVLILGENDAHAARYVAPPYVYSVDLVGENCGPIAAEAVTRTDRFAVWWGDRNFWIYDGSVQKLQCDVMDFLYDDLDTQQRAKVTAFTNTSFSEVWWLYQSVNTTTTEVDSYVVWNYRANTWNTGRLDRTTGIDKGVLADPHMVSSNGRVFIHELDGVLPSETEGTPFVESGPIDMQNGERNVAVRYIYPDNEAPNDVQFTLLGRQFPNATEVSYGPYSYNNPVPTRAIGRSIRVKVDFLTSDSELGHMRLDVAPMGTGKR